MLVNMLDIRILEYKKIFGLSKIQQKKEANPLYFTSCNTWRDPRYNSKDNVLGITYQVPFEIGFTQGKYMHMLRIHTVVKPEKPKDLIKIL